MAALREPNASFWSGKSVVVTGGSGFLGKATVRMLDALGAQTRVPRSAEYDLVDPAACRDALGAADVVLHLAANVGGIGFNSRNPAPVVHDNLAMGVNVFEACKDLGVGKLVAACSVCTYPRNTPAPFREENLWNGYPDESSAAYGLAKKMLIVLSDAYRRQYGFDSCVPVLTNLYGPGDNFGTEDSHVVAAMIQKYATAADRGEPEVVLWGTGEPSRELLYVDDAARAMILAAENADSSEPFNVGTGVETKIRDLAHMVSEAVGYEGETSWDTSRPDGQPVRCLDVSRARERIGFEARVPLEEGLRLTVEDFRSALSTSARSDG
jgi:GDP-L-fucose synthase